MIDAPEGFVLRSAGEATCVLDPAIADAAIEAGLGRPWELLRPRPEVPGTGRGPRAVIPIPGGPPLLVKQYLRGGIVALVNRARYFDVGRFLRELDTGRRAAAAGVPTARPLGIVLTPAHPGWRAWGMSAFVADAIDLARLLAEEADPARRAALWDEARRFCELLLERGLEHKDLNLGNILRGEEHLFVIDLDRAVMHDGPVPEEEAESVRERLERSHRKILGRRVSGR